MRRTKAALAAALLTASITAWGAGGTVTAQRTYQHGNDKTIAIGPGVGPATPYGTGVAVNNIKGKITYVEVVINGYGHTFPDDTGILLVSPAGQSVLLMANVGGSNPVSGRTLVISDAGDGLMPDAGTLMSGHYRPTQHPIPTLPTFPAPAPAGPHGTTMSVFNGTDPMGIWHLYVVDDAGGDAGTIDSWSLFVATDGPNTLGALKPARLFDTRPSQPQGASSVPKQRIAAGQHIELQVTGRAGVPATGVGAVSLNVTATGALAPGFVTVWGCGTRPLASNVNYRATTAVANAVMTPVSPTGTICVFADSDVHVLADVNAWFATGVGFVPVTPTRVFDTRPSAPQGATPVVKQKVQAGATLEVQVTGVAGIQFGPATAVSLNVTATGPEGSGYLTVYPCDGEPPLSSNLNFVTGQAVANAVLTELSPTGTVCFFAARTTHVLADVNGWFTRISSAELDYFFATPGRLIDTRPSAPAGGIPVPKQRLTPGVPLKVQVVEPFEPVYAPYPVAYSFNVTATGADAAGFLTVYPCGAPPLASNVNFQANTTVPNAVIAPVSKQGEICFVSDKAVHLIVDATGIFLDTLHSEAEPD